MRVFRVDWTIPNGLPLVFHLKTQDQVDYFINGLVGKPTVDVQIITVPETSKEASEANRYHNYYLSVQSNDNKK